MKNSSGLVRTKTNLFILTIISIIAGLHLLLTPEDVNEFVIRVVGFVWILEGIFYAMELRLRYLKNKGLDDN
jgi:uncharacterized membrane protein HdeD (DUF308 family)